MTMSPAVAVVAAAAAEIPPEREEKSEQNEKEIKHLFQPVPSQIIKIACHASNLENAMRESKYSKKILLNSVTRECSYIST